MTDAEQDAVINLEVPSALVLAGPGCGKTHILARRVYSASMRGVEARRMLCLTFTNRAAREMQQRVEALSGSSQGPFVGNIHRFCLRFLFSNRLIHPDTAIVDDDDYESFITDHVPRGLRPSKSELVKVGSWLFGKAHKFPPKIMRRPFHTYPEETIELARRYQHFKAENHLLDFDDILLRAYKALSEPREGAPLEMTGYRWIQIDEVQDLTPLQLAIVDLVKADDATVLYLGDEQQSIYGFTGDTVGALNSIKERCRGNIYHLSRNYRSPKQLVELCNSYATQFLDIDPEFLPSSVQGESAAPCLHLMHTPNPRLMSVEAVLAKDYLEQYAPGTVAVLTRTNSEAVNFSRKLESMGVDHLLIGQHDLFKGVDFKTVWSHLAVCLRPQRTAEWARLLYQTQACKTLAKARRLVRDLSEAGLSPQQLLAIDAQSDLEKFTAIMSDRETTIAVIDTETTGLDVFTDDVVQISAVKIRGGQVLPESRLSLFIETEKTLPPTVGNAVNPLLDIYDAAEKLPAERAFGILTDYLRGCVPAGHNLSFDLAVLRHNYRRRTGRPEPEELRRGLPSIDTLTMSRLLFPRLWNHSLGHLIGYLGLEGENSHNADDDVAATAELLLALHPMSEAHGGAIEMMRGDAEVRRAAEIFSREYGPLYEYTVNLLDDDTDHYPNSLSGAFQDAYLHFLARNHIKPIRRVDYVTQLIEKQIVDPSQGTLLRTQLENHLQDLLTFNEGDLYAQGIIRERLIVMTIHKAKGMEMDTVILTNGSADFGDYEESLRVFYVGMSRAKRRLVIGFTSDPSKKLGYLTALFHHFTPREIAALMLKA